MFSNFDGAAVTAVKDGMDEAKKLRQGELKTEHLLLALSKIRDDTSAALHKSCLLYTSPSPRDRQKSRMPSSA